MSDFALLALFFVHFVVFFRLWLRRRVARYARLSLLFAALVTYYAMRDLGWSDLTIGAVPVASGLRAFAYGLAAWSVVDLIRQRRGS